MTFEDARRPAAGTKTFKQALAEEVLLLDGATGTMVQGLDLKDADYGGPSYRMLADLIVFSRPRDQKDIHLAYFRAGAHGVETNTFGASAMRLAEYDFAGLDTRTFPANRYGLDLRKLGSADASYYLSREAATLGREAIEEYRREPGYDGRPLFVVGSLGPSNRVLSCTRANLKRATWDEIEENFYRQAKGLVDGGADVLLFETQQDALELKAAVFGGRRAIEEAGRDVAIMTQVTVDEHARMQIFNTDIHAALTSLQGIGIDVFGINCAIGPDLMEKAVEKLARYSKLPISVLPNAGLPVSVDGKTVFPFTPAQFTEALVRLADRYGINVVGGCCGTRPAHIQALAKEMRGRKAPRREPEPGLYLAGPQKAVLLDSSKTLVMIGERLNVRGSKKVRDAVEGGAKIDHPALAEVVNEQARDLGLGVLDVCMDSNTVDTVAALKEVIFEHTDDFPAAMCLDSFQVEALAEAIKVYPGRPMVNSISLEEYAPGLDKVDAVCAATRKHDPVYIALATGPKGPGATCAEKVEISRAIVQKAREKWGVPAEQIFVDVNVFPIGSESIEGMNFALESLKAIRAIKEAEPGVRTTVGVGNLTNGLAKKPHMRTVLTSVFLDEARKVGLDAAIINPNHYVFVEDLDPEDYALGRRVVLERDLDAFAELERRSEARGGRKKPASRPYDQMPVEEAVAQKIKDGFKERAAGKLEFKGLTFDYADAIVPQVARCIEGRDPLDFINANLMKAMKELGDGFGRGEVSLPHLLKSADVMKHAMGFLESYMKRSSGADLHAGVQYKGTVVLGTVYQDVHSIGKDLAKTLFENYGYRVIDLGVQTPLQTYLDKAKEFGATAIGASALLVQTSNHMISLARMMQEQGLAEVPFLIGGAPVNLRHAGYVAMAGGADPEAMRDNVFYCASAMDGVNTLNTLTRGGPTAAELRQANKRELVKQFARAEKAGARQRELLETLPRRAVGFGLHSLAARPWQAPVRHSIRLPEFAPRLDKKTLFGLNWRFGGSGSWEKKGTSKEALEALVATWVARADREGWVRAEGLAGIFPCGSDGDAVVVFDPVDPARELARFTFTVVVGRSEKDKFSPAQFFRPLAEGGPKDAIGVQLSTAGAGVDAAIEGLKKAGDLEGAHLLQGLGDRVAEDMAEWLHAGLRERAGVGPKCGTRYSPGYPSMVETLNNRVLFELLGAGALGVSLTEAHEFHPTSTTAAVVCFHPDAAYE